MNAIRNTRLAVTLGLFTLLTLAGCERRPADPVPVSTTTPEAMPADPPASAASPMAQ